MGSYQRGCEEAGGGGAIAVSGDAEEGETDVPFLRRQRRDDGGEFDVRRGIVGARGGQVSFEERDERSSDETGRFHFGGD